MKVSGSVFATKGDYLDYARQLKQAQIDYLHVDIFQSGSHFKISNLLDFNDEQLPLDVHLIFKKVSDEDLYILDQCKVKYLSVQYETLEDKESIFGMSEKFNGRFGIAITAKTPFSAIERYLKHINHVLFMCSEPGVSGAQFDDSNFNRIAMAHNKYPKLNLYADGGINNIIAERMSSLGVSMVVSGSYLCKDLAKLGNKAYNLKYNGEKDVGITRDMIPLNELPIIEKDCSFMKVVDMIAKYRLGVNLIVEGNTLLGIITDGDIKRAFLKYEKNIFDKTAIELANLNPFCVQKDTTMEDLINMLYGLNKGIEVIPVMDGEKVIGAVDLRIGY